MTGLLDQLSSETQEELRRLGRVADDIDWPYEVARSDGWRAANEQYHSAQKQLGRREMQSLMTALHLRLPLPHDVVQEVIMAATKLYLYTDERRVVSRI